MAAFLIITVSFAVIQAGSVMRNSALVMAEPELSCTEGWYPLGNLCYKGFKIWLPFEDAEKDCVKLGAHLAAITSAEIQEYITVYMVLDYNHWVYIGLRLPEDGSRANWTDGSNLEFQDWDIDEPSGKPHYCIEMKFNTVLGRIGKWNDVACDHRLPFVCQKAKITVPEGEKAARDPARCPGSIDGFRFGDSCYHLSSHRKPWQEAEKYCMEQYNGHLAAVKNVFVQTFFQYLLKKAGNSDRMWIGIRLMPDEIAQWSSGWYMAYTNWQDRSTHRKVNSESCGSIMKSNGQWEIGTCEETLSFICEETSVVPPPRLTAKKTGLKCPYDDNEWIDAGGNYCYIFQITNFLSWNDANFYCMTKGGTLASIHSAAEVNVLKQFITMPTHRYELYIGLFRHKRSQSNNEFEWADRSALDYTRWKIGEPNSKDELCTELIPREEMIWNDIFCHYEKGFICSVAKVSSSKDSSQQTLEGQQEEKGECFPTAAIVGEGVVCVLLVIVLTGSVFYNMKHWRKARQESRMPKLPTSEIPRYSYRVGEISQEQIYENIDA